MVKIFKVLALPIWLIIFGVSTALVPEITRSDNSSAGTDTASSISGIDSHHNGPLDEVASRTITRATENVYPVVDLSADQGSGLSRLFLQNGGNVVVTAQVTGSSAGNVNIYDWSATDNALVDIDTDDSTFTFAPTSVGTYVLGLTVTDTSLMSSSTSLIIEVVSSLPTLGNGDSDGDNISDNAEGATDSDNDGVPNYLDHYALGANALQEQKGVADKFIIRTEPGLGLQLGEIAFRAGNHQSAITEEEISNHANNGAGTTEDSSFGYEGGLFDFTVRGLSPTGQAVNIVIPQFIDIPRDAVYRKFMSGGWTSFYIDSENQIKSAPGSEGFCPLPGDATYADGLTEGHWCVQLTIVDGGPNDADGEVNGKVKDPGGVGRLTPIRVDSGGGGALSPWLMFAGLLLLLSRRIR